MTPQWLNAPALRILYSFLTSFKTYRKGKLGGVTVVGVSVAHKTQLTFKP